MPNTSATGGYLAPAASPAPLEGQSFDDFLQQVVVGISGVEGKYVRPRWQRTPPNQPDFDVDWIAFGITSQRPDTYAYVGPFGTGAAGETIQRHEACDILLSFYGPNATAVMERFREGTQIAQNREALFLAGMAHVETGEAVRLPRLDKEQWLMRVDLTWAVRRIIMRTYPVLNVLSFHGVLRTDVGVPPFTESLTV